MAGRQGHPGPRTSTEVRARRRAAIEACLRDGWAGPSTVPGCRGSAIEEAARRLTEQGYATKPGAIRRFVQTEAAAAARGDEHFTPDWRLYAPPLPSGAAPARAGSGVTRVLVTAAQDDTDVHWGFWTNLQAYAATMGARIVVGGFTYQQLRHTDRATLTATYRAELAPFLRFDQLDIGPVIFFANVNTLPTAVRPLSGLLTMSRGRDAIFPHAKVAYQTVPQPPETPVPSVMTTGACTVPNYIQKKAGVKAEFHHVLGATMVEVCEDGTAFCRPISAAADGSFHDLDARVAEGRVSRGHRLKAATWGDIHCPSVPEAIFEAIWGAGGAIDQLRPEYQFFHDLSDFAAWNRHVAGDPIHRALMVARGMAGMEWQVATSAMFLRATRRDFCRSVVIMSNHDDRLRQWATAQADRNDTTNVRYWHRCNLAVLDAIHHGDRDFDLMLWALRDADPDAMAGIDFVPIGASFRICQEHAGGIENGLHGHQGPNGSRGTIEGLAKMGTKITIGDKHAPAILDGVYCSGITGDLDQGYNTGPGSWRRAHVLTYQNGKRTIVTQSDDGRCWA